VAANSPHHDGVAQLRRVATALWADGAQVDPTLPRPTAKSTAKATVTAKATATAGARPPVRLDLGGALVSLDVRELAALRRELALRTPAPAVAESTGSALETMATRFPVAAELDALLRETAGTAAQLIAAGSGGRPARPSTPARPATPVVTPPVRPTPVQARPQEDYRSTLRVSTDAMPYLLDHCFFPQRPGWPDEKDRWPVVPATTIVGHLMDAAEQTSPGTRAVAVHGARFDQWVTAAPAVEVPVTAVPAAEHPDRFAVTFGRAARATVEVALRYPGGRPAPWGTEPATERAPDHTAAELYSERWMFHGLAFQGITEITAIGETHVRGTITTPAAPGALLDNVGQLLGYWIMATRTERTVVFPVGMRQMRFFGPHPRPGADLECLVRIVSLTDAVLEADIQLVADGEVWAEIVGWQDRRFDNHPETKPVERFPERNTLSRPQPGGWVLLHERWPDLASRDLIMRNHLAAAERAEYESRPPRGRRQWLLGRIAAKDAVRQWLWERGEGPVFPAEIQVPADEHGRPYAAGQYGRTLPDLDLTLAHRAEAAVALVTARTEGESPGIDIEEITDRDEGTLAVAFGEAERRLLAEVCAAAGEPEAMWATTFWAAKEAVAKAEGTGFLGRPRDFAVVAAEPGALVVEVAAAPGRTARRYPVLSTRTANPPGLPERDYAVAWTTGPAHKDNNEETDQ
jgi:phosphopantetheinyl transferase